MISALSDTSFLQFLVSYILVSADFFCPGRLSILWLIVISQNPRAILADLATMLLSNLSVSAAVTSAVVSMKISVIPDPKDPDAFYPVQSRSGTSPLPPPDSKDPQDVLAMPLLVDAFVQSALVDESQHLGERKRKGELHFLASIFANITTVNSTDHTTPKLITDGCLVTKWAKLLFDALSLETVAKRFTPGVPTGAGDCVH